MTTGERHTLRLVIRGFKGRVDKRKDDRPDDVGWREAHEQFSTLVAQLEEGLIQTIQKENP